MSLNVFSNSKNKSKASLVEENAFLYGSTDNNEQEDNMIGMENDNILNNEEVERGTDR